MKKTALLFVIVVLGVSSVFAQPEFYTDAYIGLPEFKALPVRLPTLSPDSVEVEVHVRVVYDDLQFVKQDDIYQADYSLDVTFRDKDDRMIGSHHVDRSIEVDSYAETNSRVKGDQIRSSFTLTPAEYVLRIDISDQETRKNRTIEKEFKLKKDEWSGPTRLGDIVLVDSVGGAHLATGLLQGPPLRVAYTMYVEKPEEVNLFFQLRDEQDRIAVADNLPLTGNGPLYSDTLSVPTDSLTDSRYQLLLFARRNGKTMMRNYPFDLLLQNLPSYISNVEMAVVQLKYIASDDEYHQLVTSRGDRRESLFRDFWKKRDPTPATPTNEKMDEYYRRVHFANESFHGYRGGWESDMGHVYIIFGPPNDIERHPFDIDRKPYEIWYYYDINRKFIFQDQEGFGEYRLISPFWGDY